MLKENYKLELNKENVIKEYNWDNITNKILSLAKV